MSSVNLFFGNITVADIGDALSLIEACSKDVTPDNLATMAIRGLEAFDSVLVKSNFLDSDLAAQMGQYWKDGRTVYHLSKKAEVWCNLLHQRSILVEITVFDFLNTCYDYILNAAQHYQVCLDSTSYLTNASCCCPSTPSNHNQAPWLTKLVSHVIRQCDNRRTSWSMSSKKYLPTLDPPIVYKHYNPNPQTIAFPTSPRFVSQVVDIALDILSNWLNLPTGDWIVKMRGFSLLRQHLQTGESNLYSL